VRVAVGLALAIAATWVGLLVSFSQSSFVALGVGVLAAAAFAWQWRVLAAAGLAAVVLVSVGFAAPNIRHNLLGHSFNRVTSDRYSLVTNGAKIAVHHPVGGVGIGGFRSAYARREGLKGRDPKKAASHDTPVTVAAETGVPGVLLFGWLLAAALLLTLRRVDGGFAGRTRLVAGLALGAIAVHSLFYNAFFEDPMAWALFGLAALAATVRAEPAA
jgi:hypothetical protein